MRSLARKGNKPASWTSSSLLTISILLLALAVRLYRLGDANLWWDEALAVWAVRKGLLGATLWTAGDVHPPLYFWALWSWVQLFGQSEYAMRALSAFAGVLTVAAVGRLGSLVGGHRVGLLAALLTALARFHVWWSQEMRMYVLAGLLGTLSLYFFLRWLRFHEACTPSEDRMDTRRWWVPLLAYVVTSIGALYTIFLTGAFLLAQNALLLWLLLWPGAYKKRSLIWQWIAAQLAIGAVVGLWLLVSWNRMPSWSTAEPLSLPRFARLYATLLATGVSVQIERYTWATLFPLVVTGVGALCMASRWRGRPAGFRREVVEGISLLLCLVVAGASIYSASLPRSLFYTPSIEARYFLPFAPMFWVLLAWSLNAIIRRWPLAGGTALAATLALWVIVLPGYYENRFLKDELQSLTRAIISQAEQGDAVLLDSGGRYPIFLYYYERANEGLWRPPVQAISYSEDPLSAQQVDATMADVSQQHARVWLAEVDVGLTDPDRLVRQWLRDHSREAFSQSFGPNALLLYDADGEPPHLRSDGYTPTHPQNPAASGEDHLTGFDLPVQTFTPGDTVHLATLWREMSEGPVALTLRNPAGQPIQLVRTTALSHSGPRRLPLDLGVEDTMPEGEYLISLSTALGRWEPLVPIQVANSSARSHAGEMQTQINARVGEHLVLEGYALHSTFGDDDRLIEPGGTLFVDLYWRATSAPGADYTVFVHLLSPAHNPRTMGPVWGQHDSPPANGHSPTSQWLAGDTLVDRHPVAIDAQAPGGEYRIEVGMYDRDGQRLSLAAPDGRHLGDHLVLETTLAIVPR